MTKKLTKTQEAIAEACNNDLTLIMFVAEWLSNGNNALQAYKKLHPEVTDGTARVMGSRLLMRVDKSLLLDAYGLNAEMYLQQLYDGNKADKWNDFTGEREPDHKTRAIYHTKLGKIMGIEDERTNVQVNILNHIQKEREEFDE